MNWDRQGPDVILVGRGNFAAPREAEHRLGGCEVLSFQNADSFQLQSVRSGHAHKKQSQCHRGHETIYFVHSSLPRSKITNSSDLFTSSQPGITSQFYCIWMMGTQ